MTPLPSLPILIIIFYILLDFNQEMMSRTICNDNGIIRRRLLRGQIHHSVDF
jgi:hypothetical protein